MTKLAFSTQLRPDRAVISVGGAGALAFLHGLLTCDVAGLADGQAAYGALLSAQGKIQHDMFVFHAGEVVLIDCAVEQRAALLQKLMLYKLRAKLEILPRDDLAVAVGDEGYPDPRLAAMGNRQFVAADHFKFGEGYDAARIALGLADSVQDIGTNVLFPHEANFDQLNGVSFSKGCYVGQEVVSRMQHRGTARSRILPILCDPASPAKGAAILNGGKAIGEILSSTGSHALALIRIDRLADAQGSLLSGTVRVSVIKPIWATYDLETAT
jgi:tRNA-modifying protein YgfZ